MPSPHNDTYRDIDRRTVLATLLVPFGEWVVEVDQHQDEIRIRRKSYGQYGGRTGARRLLLVDGGEA